MAKAQPKVRVQIVKVERRTLTRKQMGRAQYARIYLHQQDSTPVGEMLTLERYNKPHEEIKRDHWAAILKKAGLPANTKGKWNVHAGCSMCPCSPGFVTDFKEWVAIWVTYKYVNEQGKTMTRPVNREMRKQLKAQAVPV